MAILDSEKLDFLWKKILYGVSKTANAATKFASNETIPSPSPVLPSSVWKEGDDIPGSAPGATTSIVRVYAGVDRIRLTSDPTSPANVAWIAAGTYGNLATRQVNFIPPTFGSSYAARVFIGDPNVGPAARIFPDTTNEEWVFDYAAGALVFTGTIPANKTATIGTGTVSVSTSGVYVEIFQYVGDLGVGSDAPPTPSLGELPDVELSTGPQEGDVLTYKDGIWQAEPVVPPPTSLEGLSDVELNTGAVDGDVLTYKDGIWQAEPAGTGGALGTMSTQDSDDVDITGGQIANVTLINVTVDGGEF